MTLLGKDSPTPTRYAPEILFPIPRSEARQRLGIAGELPFHGEDVWHGWELSWLDAQGTPQSAVARFAFPATSTNLVESKSFKLYLNSLNGERFDSTSALSNALAKGDPRSAARVKALNGAGILTRNRGKGPVRSRGGRSRGGNSRRG